MANAAVEAEAVDLESEDDDLMDEDVHDDEQQLRGAHIPRLKSAITKNTKGRGFRHDFSHVDRHAHFDSLASDDGPGPERSIEGWIILVTGIHEEAQEDDIHNAFGEFGEIKNLHLNLDRRTGFVKGYALIEYENYEITQRAINEMDGTELLTEMINVDWAFSKRPIGWRRRSPQSRRSRSPRRRH